MLRLHVFNTGWLTTQERHLYVGGGNAPRTLPVLCFVIEHPQGLVVFDTGLHESFATEPRHYEGWLRDRIAPFRSKPGKTLSAQMRARGLSPERVTHVTLSHLHYDHTGNAHAFAHARILVTRQEWSVAQSRMHNLRGYLWKECTGLAPTLFEFPQQRVLTLEEATTTPYGVDLMGDGSLILAPTFGHTSGHQALLAFLPYGVVLLAGDAVYVQENYLRPAAQPWTQAPDLAWRSLMGLRALAKGEPGALILPAHDERALEGISRPDIMIEDLSLASDPPPKQTPPVL